MDKIIPTQKMRKARKQIIQLQAKVNNKYYERVENEKKVIKLKNQIKDAVIGFGNAVKLLNEEINYLDNKLEEIESKKTEANNELNMETQLFFNDFGIHFYDSNIIWEQNKKEEKTVEKVKERARREL